MQRIVPFMWFNNRTEEAVGLYTSLFANSEVVHMSRIPDGPAKGSATCTFRLERQEFMAIDGGPQFTFTPAVSFYVNCGSREEIDRLYAGLSKDGGVLMPLDAYPFSERYCWIHDRFGVSWQLNLTGRMPKIAPCLMFVGEHHGQAEEAIHFYMSIFDNASIEMIARHGPGTDAPEGSIVHGAFTLDGLGFVATESHIKHEFTFTPAISFFVNCDTQDEIDAFWGKLSESGHIQQCGWLQDKFGVSWQIVPRVLGEMLYGKDTTPEQANRVTQAMLKMVKLDIGELEAAYA